jgi:hypothetical protein
MGRSGNLAPALAALAARLIPETWQISDRPQKHIEN